jgi:hypothetical protein
MLTAIDDQLLDPATSLDTMWTRYVGFTPNPEADFVDEFKRLAGHQGWDEGEREHNRRDLLKAEFDYYYGNDDESLPNWQKLCRVCLIDPAPETIEKCTSVC